MGFDKLWADLGGRPVLAWSLATLSGCRAVDRLVVVTGAERLAAAGDLVERSVPACLDAQVVVGGERRRDSVQAGIATLDDCAWVLVHDAARPFVTEAVVERGLEAVEQTGACVAAVPARDTIKRVRDGTVIETPPRDQLCIVQTPQLFRRDVVLGALAATHDDATDEAGLVERIGGAVRVYPGDPLNLKITTPADLEVAQAVLALRAGEVGG
jgi:2-C-methyl-D-erythritol 4-phosphate cytidylyltransferase